jgi:guanylate cyclase, other
MRLCICAFERNGVHFSQIDLNQVVNDVFPPHIAAALLEGRAVEPEHLDMVSVFFSDVVGYTTMCSTLPANKVSSMLDRLYTRFDALCARHGITKIDTIGDA